MFHPTDGLGELGERVPGPPWILGRRGLPLAAPENTRVSLEAALELGMDGVHYEVRSCASGELVLLADAELDRTSDGHGRLALRTLPEIARLDAGSWFHRRFAGEPLALLDEALEQTRGPRGDPVMHWIELAESTGVDELARVVARADQRRSLRVASRRREVCIELRDLGFSAMWLAQEAGAAELDFAREARLAAVGVGPGGWRGAAASDAWPCERWAFAVDAPGDLLAAARLPVLGLSTREPLRAFAARTLVRFAPTDHGDWPVSAPQLECGEDWSGRWRSTATVRNPFGWSVDVVLGLRVRRGAFGVDGLPTAFPLAAGESREVQIALDGGSWSPGGDPLLVAAMRWSRGPGRPEERVFFDAPLHRVRRLRLIGGSQRLTLLRERPGDPPASVIVSRGRGRIQASIENAGGLTEAQIFLLLDGELRRGDARVQAALDSTVLARRAMPFSVALRGREGDAWRWRRWAGGIPDEFEAGGPGWLERGVGS